jgi:hypothetical protein
MGKYNIVEILLKKGAYIIFEDKSVNNMIIQENGIYRVNKYKKSELITLKKFLIIKYLKQVNYWTLDSKTL